MEGRGTGRRRVRAARRTLLLLLCALPDGPGEPQREASLRDEIRRRRDERQVQTLERTVEEEARPPVDEDAADFLDEAAAAAAAAALDAQALAEEIEAEELALAEASAQEPADPEKDAAEEAAEVDAAAVAAEVEVAADGEAADLAGGATDSFDEVAQAAEGAKADAVSEDPVEAVDGDEGKTPDASAEAAAEGDSEAALDADAHEAAHKALDDEAPTPEEEALAQAEGEDDEEDVEPADIAEPEEELLGSFEKIAARARRLDDDQARHVLHSILFVADKPLAIEQLRAATGLEPARIRSSLERLAGELREGISGVVLSEVAGGWQLRTAPESSEFVRRFLQVKPRRLTRAALETLAIIAYRQPVTRPEIEDIRGVDSGAVVKALLDWKLIKILGKKDEPGRPLLYGTSREFLEFFQLKNLSSLPTLREFHELNEESVQIVEEELGPEAAQDIAGTVAALTDPEWMEAEKERIAKSEQALAELEHALADAEAKAADVADSIDPKSKEPAPPPDETEGA